MWDDLLLASHPTMFKLLLSLSPISIWALVFACLAAFFLGRKAIVDYKIRKLGAVRSPVLGTNPLTGMGKDYVAKSSLPLPPTGEERGGTAKEPRS